MVLNQSHLVAEISVYVCVSKALHSPPHLHALIFLSLAELMAVGFGQGEDVEPFQKSQ